MHDANFKNPRSKISEKDNVLMSPWHNYQSDKIKKL